MVIGDSVADYLSEENMSVALARVLKTQGLNTWFTFK